MREYTYVGAAVTSGMVDDGTLRRLEGRVSVVGNRALSPVSTSKYGLELEVDGGSGGC